MNKIAFLLLVVAPLTLSVATAQQPAAGYRSEIEVAPLLRTTVDAAGQPLVYPRTETPQVTAVKVTIPPGAETGWHKHPYPCFAYVLSGTLAVEMEGGTVHQLGAGQALAESVNVRHNGRNATAEPVTLVMFVMGEREKPFTEKAP